MADGEDEDLGQSLDFPGVGHKIDFAKTISQGGSNVIAKINWAHDVTPAAAAAMADRNRSNERVAALTHHKPALHRTIRHVLSGAVSCGGLVLIYLKPEIGIPVAIIIAALNGASIADSIKGMISGKA